ncbi:MAG: hypothetical protein ACK452_09730, partial [Bacteroidota bacterium]
MRIFLLVMILTGSLSIAQTAPVDCLYDYFSSGKNIDFITADTLSQNRSSDKLIPLGWSKTGKFTYYIVPQNVCGLCSAKLECFDVESNKVIANNSFDFQNLIMEENEKKCLEIKKIEKMKQNLFSDHSIIPLIKSDFKYINIKNPDFSYANHKFILMQNKKSASLTLGSPD